MSEDWTAVAAEVTEGLQEVGKTAYLVRPEGSYGKAHDPEFTDDVNYPVTVVFSKWDSRLVDGTLIRTTDKKALVSVTSFAPRIGDKFWNGDINHLGDPVYLRVVDPIEEIAPAGEAVLYTLNLRA